MSELLIYHINIIGRSESSVLLKYLENNATVWQCWEKDKCFTHELEAQK